MQYPVVTVKTSDGLDLEGLLFVPDNPTDTIKIHFHGTAGNFYSIGYYQILTEKTLDLGISQLNTNNRGHGIYEVEKDTFSHGASLEKFEDCLLDIDAWIEFVISRGYKKIILEGHSFGTEKIVYYMNKGKYKDQISAIILLGFSDSVGTQQKYEKNLGKSYLSEAQDLINQGKREYLLSDLLAMAGELPVSAQTYLNFFSENSELSQTLPLKNGKDLKFFQNIKVPVLGVISDNQDSEYTIIPISEAIELLKKENPLAEVYQIKNTIHNFGGKEQELSDLICDFFKRKVLV